MKTTNYIYRYGWAISIAVLSALIMSPLFGVEVPFISSEWLAWYLGVMGIVAVGLTVVFTLVYGLFLLAFPKRSSQEQLRNHSSSSGMTTELGRPDRHDESHMEACEGSLKGI